MERFKVRRPAMPEREQVIIVDHDI